MKKRITCMLLALCMVLAAVPAAVAAPVVEDQIDVSLLEKQLGNESQLLQAEVVQKLQKDAAEPMDAEASGDAEIFPHTSCVNQYRLIGDKIHLEGFAYVPETAVGQEWNIALFAGAKLTEDGYLGGWYNYFDDGAGLADGSREGSPEVKKICIARGQTLTNYYLRFEPMNTTDNRYAMIGSSDLDVLVANEVGGFLLLNAKQYGTVSVGASNIRTGVMIPVEICTDDKGHDYSKEVVDSQPTCTEEGHTHIECSKCGHRKSSSSTPALGHSWDAGKITKEETEEAWGEKLYTCTRCGATKTAPYHTCPGAIFTDMPKDDNWSHKGIDYCVKNQLMNGMENNRFQPFLNTTRAQLVTVLWRMAGSPEPESETPFEDLKAGSFYEKAVTWGYENGIVNGVTETAFYPNSSVTREQMAAFFYRYAEEILKVDVSARKDITTFPDYGETFGYSRDCLSWACAVELINGVSNGSVTYLQPKSGATRAQIATVLMRFCENIVPEVPETPEVPEVPEA